MSEKNSSQESLSEKIIRQIEYYFGDINLSKDKFMQDEIQKDSGWIELETLCKFNRLKVLSTDFQVITDALKQSTTNLLEIDEENKKVRRAKPLPEDLGEFETNLKQNTVYVKGFPNTITLDQLYEFFEKHGKILQIFMRRFPATKQFKGSVFVTFDTAELMKTFLALEEIKYEDQVLNRESQEEYITRKGPELQKFKDARKKKEQQKEDKIKQQQEAEEAYLKEQKILGAILHLKGINEEGTRENLKELFDNFATIKYVDYNKGLPEAYLRFAKENDAKEALAKALEANSGEIKLKGVKLEVRVLEGDEEQEYWKTIISKLASARSNKKHNNNSSNRRNKKNNNNHRSYNKGDKKRSHDKEDGDDNNNNSKNSNDDAGEAHEQKNGVKAESNGGAAEAANEDGETPSKKIKV